MKKFTKKITSFVFVVLLGISLTGCRASTKKTKELWSANFSDGNNNLFGIYGTVENGENFITLKPNQNQNYAGSTYFGETDKNYDWNKGGMSVKLSLDLSSSNFINGDYMVWSLALNEKDGAYITENSVFFVGTENSVKFISKNVGVDTDYNALASEDAAVTVKNDVYTVIFDYDVVEENKIMLNIKLNDASGKEVYKSTNNQVVAIDHEGYVSGSALVEENIGGLRYLWLARTTVNAKITGLQITE